MEIIKKTARKIRDLKIQGATNIAFASLAALREDFEKEGYQKIEMLEKKIGEFKRSRPTEPLLFNCLDYLFSQVKSSDNLNSLPVIVERLKKRLLNNQEKIAATGVELIKNRMTVFTHCHSTTVVEVLRRAKRKGKNFRVFLTETRPLHQGRITAKELIKEGIEVTMVVDSAAPYIVSKEDRIPIDLVLLGCDVILPKKGVFNKIGSYGIALSSFESKIPVFIAGSLLKTSTKPVVIEKRKIEEICQSHQGPEGHLSREAVIIHRQQ